MPAQKKAGQSEKQIQEGRIQLQIVQRKKAMSTGRGLVVCKCGILKDNRGYSSGGDLYVGGIKEQESGSWKTGGLR